jgi:carboxyl-terminal processing protease
MNRNKSNRLMPLIMAVCVVVGVVIGTFYTSHFSGNRLSIINSSGNKLNNLLHIVDDQYVDTVDINKLVEDAMPQILAELDPHSVYIGAKDVQAVNDDLRGSFSGVGIEFTIREDTIRVQNVVNAGPADRAGVKAGDKIVSVDGKPFVGKIVTNDEAMRRLKGPKDTKVKLGLLGYGEKKVRYVTITRDDIPQRSISATYMINDNTGYIKVKSFGENTYPELLISLAKLSQEDLQNLIIDLRGNVGGYMMAVIQMVNEFLPKDRLIVYTQGRKSPRQEYRSDGRGSYQKIPLVVLIDEGSASASEIFAGAIQDNDRGTVIGRRSFGKGLVQQPMAFNDGSMIRLTIARYYTPSGRCIQKPYTSGSDKDYEDDLMMRYQHGEYFSQDSIKHEGPEYHTSIGRTVYGGGGITPDIFVAEDTLGVTSYYKEAGMTGLIFQFAYDYTDENRARLGEFTDMESLLDYLKKQNLVERFASYADRKGLRRRNLMIRKSHHLLERFIDSRIIYNMLDDEAWIEYLNLDDPAIEKAVDVFKAKQAFPKKPVEPRKADKGGKTAMTVFGKGYDYRGTHVSCSLTAKG